MVHTPSSLRGLCHHQAEVRVEHRKGQRRLSPAVFTRQKRSAKSQLAPSRSIYIVKRRS
jgi:hypothetical protein